MVDDTESSRDNLFPNPVCRNLMAGLKLDMTTNIEKQAALFSTKFGFYQTKTV
jgi:hypothetical protein